MGIDISASASSASMAGVGYAVGRTVGRVVLWLESIIFLLLLIPVSRTAAGTGYFTWYTRLRVGPYVGFLSLHTMMLLVG